MSAFDHHRVIAQALQIFCAAARRLARRRCYARCRGKIFMRLAGRGAVMPLRDGAINASSRCRTPAFADDATIRSRVAKKMPSMPPARGGTASAHAEQVAAYYAVDAMLARACGRGAKMRACVTMRKTRPDHHQKKRQRCVAARAIKRKCPPRLFCETMRTCVTRREKRREMARESRRFECTINRADGAPIFTAGPALFCYAAVCQRCHADVAVRFFADA